MLMFVHRAGDNDARGKAAAVALLAGPAYSYAKDSYSNCRYFSTSMRLRCLMPCVPRLRCPRENRAGAYRAVKALIRLGLSRLIEDDLPLPQDPVVSVKHLRINLLEIHREVNLR